MPRVYIGTNVFDTALDRLSTLYEEGHRLVISFSAGKDSGAVLEMAILAATLTDRLPVEVVLRDEEAMFPGTYEYAERVAERPEVSMTWLTCPTANINVYNRAMPYYWLFDPELSPSQWMREPPAFHTPITDIAIDAMTTAERFPPPPGKQLYSVLGLRVSESKGRLMGLFSSGGYITKPNRHGISLVRPIYDWADGDVWKAHADHGWDYNSAYDAMHRLGVKRSRLRIAPPAQNIMGAPILRVAQQAWPRWFDKLSERLPGVRLGAQFGLRACQPWRRPGETYQECFKRECIDTAPTWIAERAERVATQIVKTHAHHSTRPLPEVGDCPQCTGDLGCWKNLCRIMYGGDPHSLKTHLPYVEPEFFRPGGGTWGGKPSF
jgi:predicted phosphoadenosine phosphosulfate sulfurtransferase